MPPSPITLSEHDTLCNRLQRELDHLRQTAPDSPAYLSKLYEVRHALKARLACPLPTNPIQ
jgi:hypothetical protein